MYYYLVIELGLKLNAHAALCISSMIYYKIFFKIFSKISSNTLVNVPDLCTQHSMKDTSHGTGKKSPLFLRIFGKLIQLES